MVDAGEEGLIGDVDQPHPVQECLRRLAVQYKIHKVSVDCDVERAFRGLDAEGRWYTHLLPPLFVSPA
jgi:hypothetical protein